MHRHFDEVTEIIPLVRADHQAELDLANLDEGDFGYKSGFDLDERLLLTPERNDRDDARAAARERLSATDLMARVSQEMIDAGELSHPPDGLEMTQVGRRGGQHRKQATSAARGRLLISAMAVGGAATAAHTATAHSNAPATETVLTANASALTGGSGGNAPRGIQVIAAQPAANVAAHNEELAHGVAFANERAQREARLQQPLYVMPTKGIFTSNFGYRWGVMHAGIDLANAIGTPILAVSDGVVIDVGPTAGYGMWVKLRHADGTVTLYGHVNTTLVSMGERVVAGDQIATMGNRGFSTGPHLHFEVLLNGTERTDPVPWLAKRGLYVGAYVG